MSEEAKKFRIIPIAKTWMWKQGEERDAGILLTKAIKSLSCQYNINKRMYMTGLTEEEARKLEEQLLLPAKTLSPYNASYWGSHKNNVKIPKEGKILNLENPIDYIAYKMCLVNTLVANGKEDPSLPFAEFLLTSEDSEAKTINKKYEVKQKAYKMFSDMSLEDMINFSKLWEGGKNKVTNGHTPDMIKTVVGKVVDEKPQDFITLMEDPDYNTKLLLNDLISTGNIKMSGTRFFIVGDTEPFAMHVTKAIEYLQDPLNQNIVLDLKNKMVVNKKKSIKN